MASTVELNIVIKDQGASTEVRKVTVSLGDLSNASKASTSAMRDTSSSFGAIGAQYAKLAAGVAAVTAVIGGAAAAAVAAVNDLARLGSELTDLSARTGLTTQSIQELTFAGSLVGVTFDQVAPAIAIMQRNIAGGSEAFDKLGLSVEALAGMNPDQQFVTIASAIAAIEDPTQRAAAAMGVFGRGAAQILPLLKSDLAAAAEEARRLGIVLGDDTVAAADELDDTTTKLSAAWDGLKNQLAAVVVESGLVGWLQAATAGVGTFTTGVRELTGALEAQTPMQAAFKEFLLSIAPTAAQNIVQLSRLGELMRGLSGPDSAGAPKVGMGGIFAPPDQGNIKGPSPLELFRDDELLRKAKEADEASRKAAEAASRARVEAYELGRTMEEVGEGGMTDVANGLFAMGTSSLGLVDSFGSVTTTTEEMDAAVRGFNDAEQAHAEKTQAAARATYEAAQAELARIAGLYELANALMDVAGVAASAAGLFQALGVSADSGLGKVVGMVQGMAEAGANFAASMASGNIAGMIGSAIDGVTSLIKGIGGLFGKSDAEKAGEIAGRVLGVAISKGLAEAISKTSKELGIAKEAATLLHLGEAMDESGESAASFGDSMLSLLQAIEGGAVPAEEGIAALGDAFNRLAEEAAAGSVAAMAQMGKLAQEARAMGQEIPEITAAVKASVQASAGALSALGGIKLVSEEDAKAQAQIFLNVFNSVLATEGIVAAAEAVKPALDEFRKQLSEGGLDKGAIDTILGPINAGMSLLKNEMTRGGAEGAQALKTILESQLSAGFLDIDTFAAIQQQAKTTFDQMVAGGADTGAAFQAVAPLLAQLQQAAVATGQALDPVTQQMIDQAKAAGVAFPTDTGQQMVTLLGQVVELLGGVPAVVAPIGPAFDAASSQASDSLQTIPAAGAAAFDQTVAMAQGSGDQLANSYVMASDQANAALLSIGQVTPNTAPVAALTSDVADLLALAIRTKDALSGMGSGVGSIAIGEPGHRIPGLQGGGYVPEIPSMPAGSVVRMAERGTGGEYAVPGKAMESMARAMWSLAAAVGHSGSGGSWEIDGEVLARSVGRGARDNSGELLTMLNQGQRRRGGG